MKSFIVAVIIAAVLSIFSLYYTYCLDKAAARLGNENSQIMTALEDGDFESAATKADKLVSEIYELEPFLAMFGNHEDIDNIEISLAELKIYAQNKQQYDALAKANAISVLFEHLPKNTRLRTENIL